MAANLFPKVILFGDSLTQYSFSEGGWGSTVADYFQRKCDVLNRGFSGYTSAVNKVILPKILQCDNSPKGSVVAVTVLLGSNDSVMESVDVRGLTVEQYISNMSDIVSQFIADGIPARQIILLTPPAVAIDMHTKYCRELGREMPLSAERVKSFAEKCANLGKKLGVDVINLYSLFYEQPNWESFLCDGLHLSKEGNHFVADHVIKALEPKVGHLPLVFPDWKDLDPKNPAKVLLDSGKDS